MMQFDLFGAPAPANRAARANHRPDLPLLLLASADHSIGAAPAAPRFTKQATPDQAHRIIADLNASRDSAFCLSKIGGNETAKRAIEIAITGNHRCAILGADIHFLACAWNLCGNAESAAHIESPEDRSQLPSFQMVVEDEAENPYDDPETSAQILARIGQARQRIAAQLLPLEMDAPALQLMDKAQEAIGFNNHERAALINVARTIAHMAECDDLRRIHVAEALSYWRGVRL